MFPFLSSTVSSTQFASFQAVLADVFTQILAADTATLLAWMEVAAVILGIAFFGVFPALSLLTGAMTLASLPLWCRGRTQENLRQSLGLADPKIPEALQALDAHLTKIRSDLPRTLVWLLAIGQVPFLGVVFGLIYYRLSPIAALRARIDNGDLGLLRWLLPLAAAGFIAIQPIPVVGPFALPLLYATYHAVYDTMLKRRQHGEAILPIAA